MKPAFALVAAFAMAPVASAAGAELSAGKYRQQDPALFDCVQRKVTVSDMRYQTRGGLPFLVFTLRNGLDWPLHGVKVEYDVAPTSAEFWDGSNVGWDEFEPPLAPGEERVVEIRGINFVGDATEGRAVRSVQVIDVQDPDMVKPLTGMINAQVTGETFVWKREC